MTTRKRKTLKDNDVAKAFVRGEDKTAPSPQSQSPKLDVTPAAPPRRVKPDIMAELASPEKEATVRLTVDLAKSLHTKLSIAAAKTGRSKAEIVRYLIEEALGD